MLKINEIKDIMKAIKSLKSRRILSKETSAKIICHERGLLSLLGPLMRVSLPLIKNILMSLVKSVFVPLELMATA